MANIGTWLYTRFKGQLVGEDRNGNRYYQARSAKTRPLYNRKRWVIYKGAPNPLDIAPEWLPWLQYIVDEPLGSVEQPWRSEPVQPNKTGTASAYFPEGDERAGGKRAANTGDIQSWKPRA